jgi:hypothetical protein
MLLDFSTYLSFHPLRENPMKAIATKGFFCLKEWTSGRKSTPNKRLVWPIYRGFDSDI